MLLCRSHVELKLLTFLRLKTKIKCGLHVSVKCMCSDYSQMRNPICYDYAPCHKMLIYLMDIS